MLNLTPEERKVILFVLGLAFCGLILSNLIKANRHIEKIIIPQVQLAKIDINRVTLNELSGIRGVPAKLARRIIEFRNLHHEFSSLEELKEIKGIGDQRCEKLKEVFFVE